MRAHNAMRDEEAIEAAREAGRGAIYGAVKYGAFMALVGGIGHAMSPVYRGLTIQFKVYIQMSGMAVGSMLEADHRLRLYEARVRQHRRMMRQQARLKALEDDEE